MTCPECGQPVEAGVPYCTNPECGALLPSVLLPPAVQSKAPAETVVTPTPAEATTTSPSGGRLMPALASLLALILSVTVVWLVRDRPDHRDTGPVRYVQPAIPAGPTWLPHEVDGPATPAPIMVAAPTASPRPSSRATPKPARATAAPPKPAATTAAPTTPYLTATVRPFCLGGSSWAFDISGRMHNAPTGYDPWGGADLSDGVYLYELNGGGTTSFSGTVPPSWAAEEIHAPSTQWTLQVSVSEDMSLDTILEVTGTVSNPC